MMGKPETISIEVASEIVEAANSAVAGGEYPSIDHVLHAALRDWKERRDRDIVKLRTLVEEGVRSGFEPHDGMTAIKQAAREVLANLKG